VDASFGSCPTGVKLRSAARRLVDRGQPHVRPLFLPGGDQAQCAPPASGVAVHFPGARQQLCRLRQVLTALDVPDQPERGVWEQGGHSHHAHSLGDHEAGHPRLHHQLHWARGAVHHILRCGGSGLVGRLRHVLGQHGVVHKRQVPSPLPCAQERSVPGVFRDKLFPCLCVLQWNPHVGVPALIT